VSTKIAVLTADYPRVNLLPPEIQENRAFKRVQIGLGAVVLVAIGGVLAMQMNGQGAVHSAKAALAADADKAPRLQKTLNGLQYVTQAKSNSDAAKATIKQVRSTNVHWADFLNNLSLTLPPNDWYTSLGFSQKVLPGSLAAGTAAPSTIGTITFAGAGLKHNDVAAWLDAMAKEDNLIDPTFSQSNEILIGSTKTIQFQGSVSVTSGAIQPCDDQGVC
jgi:Tfp pilus assembly protein PilN